jgi:hypothetical protein
MTPHPKQRYRIRNGNGKGTIVKLSRDEIVAYLEKGAKDRCGYSARKLLRKHRENSLSNAGAVADLLALSYLLKKDDPIFSEN